MMTVLSNNGRNGDFCHLCTCLSFSEIGVVLDGILVFMQFKVKTGWFIPFD